MLKFEVKSSILASTSVFTFIVVFQAKPPLLLPERKLLQISIAVLLSCMVPALNRRTPSPLTLPVSTENVFPLFLNYPTLKSSALDFSLSYCGQLLTRHFTLKLFPWVTIGLWQNILTKWRQKQSDGNPMKTTQNAAIDVEKKLSLLLLFIQPSFGCWTFRWFAYFLQLGASVTWRCLFLRLTDRV